MDHVDDDRTKKEQEYLQLCQESEKIMQGLFSVLEKHKERDPVGLLKMVCLAVLGREGEEHNTFLGLIKLEDDGVDTAKRMYGDFAEIILDHLSRKSGEISEQLQSRDGFVPFVKIIERNLSINRHKILQVDLSWPLGTAPAMSRCQSVMGRFFSAFAYDLAIAIDLACRLIYEGVPLYEMLNGDGGYDLLSDSRLSVYIEKKGELTESGETTDIPSWTKNLFVKESDLNMHSVFYKSGSYDCSHDEILIRRRALRSAIQIPDVEVSTIERAPNTTCRGELLLLTHQVQSRFWDLDRFDISDPDTYPKQADIIEWIKTQKSGISDAEAKAVEKVACPIKR